MSEAHGPRLHCGTDPRSDPRGLLRCARINPVVAFGDARIATAATLGLNPSRVEFLNKQGRELVGRERRLATHTSLGTWDLANGPLDVVGRVLEDCNGYFHRNPYRQWFDQLERILNECEKSYYDGSACHLDLVQWATNPTWARLRPVSLRKDLLHTDAPFLIQQLRSESIRLLLLNGMGVIRQMRRIGCHLNEVDRITGTGYQNTKLFLGQFDHIHVVGWSTNIQSSFGVSDELRSELARGVANLLKN